MTVSSVVLFNDVIIFSVLFSIPFLKISNIICAYLTTEQIFSKNSLLKHQNQPKAHHCIWKIWIIFPPSQYIFLNLYLHTFNLTCRFFVQSFSITRSSSAVLQTVLTWILSYSWQNVCLLHPHPFPFIIPLMNLQTSSWSQRSSPLGPSHGKTACLVLYSVFDLPTSSSSVQGPSFWPIAFLLLQKPFGGTPHWKTFER